LDNCEVPKRFYRFHWCDLFEPDGFEKVLKAVRSEITGAEVILPIMLRSQPLNHLLEDDVVKMLQEKDFADVKLNRFSRGVQHQYETLSRHEEKFILDHTTGLIWQQSGTCNEIRYFEADEYINNLNRKCFAGYNDWHLPTLEEAMSLMESERKNVMLYIDPLFDSLQTCIWSADVSEVVEWSVNFVTGRCSCSHFPGNTSRYYVRAVCTGQSIF
jgi:hypothetical protein